MGVGGGDKSFFASGGMGHYQNAADPRERCVKCRPYRHTFVSYISQSTSGVVSGTSTRTGPLQSGCKTANMHRAYRPKA